MPLISVIVPIYKVEPYIRRCIDSILSQTFTDFELILVDDGSPDNCPIICDEYAKKDIRIHVIHQQNGGLSAARNVGIDWAFANSDSRWLSFVDSDDLVHPCFLEFLYRAVNETGLKVSSCEIRRVETEIEMLKMTYNVRKMAWDEYYLSDWVRGVVACNKLYEKRLFDKNRYPIGKTHEDEYLTYRILACASVISVIDAELYLYFQNPEGIMKSGFSLQKLDIVPALQEQCQFAKDNGYIEFYRDKRKSLINKLASLIMQCKDAENLTKKEKKKGLRYLRSKLRKVLFEERRTVFEKKKKMLYYECAYPSLLWFYWTCVGVFGKIKRMVKRDV